MPSTTTRRRRRSSNSTRWAATMAARRALVDRKRPSQRFSSLNATSIKIHGVLSYRFFVVRVCVCFTLSGILVRIVSNSSVYRRYTFQSYCLYCYPHWRVGSVVHSAVGCKPRCGCTLDAESCTASYEEGAKAFQELCITDKSITDAPE